MDATKFTTSPPYARIGSVMSVLVDCQAVSWSVR
jgi:hypothetical protein